MAIYPDRFETKDTLMPGGRGEQFIQSLPGDRSNETRIGRSQNNLNVSPHDVPNIKYSVDDRLPALFKYGFAVGFNHMIAPKGRIAAIDPFMDLIDFDSHYDPVQGRKLQYNTVTIANGGMAVQLRDDTDKYVAMGNLVTTDAVGKAMANIGKEWKPLKNIDKKYGTDDTLRSFFDGTKFESSLEQLTAGGFKLDVATSPTDQNPHTGRVLDATNKVIMNVRPGNKPVGIFQRNEYLRGTDAYNGMMAGPILTDALIELPWFLFKDKAEANLWGSAYGALKPGDLVKSDENGRFVKSPLSSDTALKDIEDKGKMSEYEAERQQVIGEVYAVNHNLVPEGAARWATWALSDRLNYQGFNPEEYTQTNRKGEDAIDHSAHVSTGTYPGYPYDKAYSDHDLNMLASSKADTFNPRMNAEYQFSELGIPGLTDGYNAFVREMPEEKGATIHYRGDNATVPYSRTFIRLTNVSIEPDSLEIKFGAKAYKKCVEGAKLGANGEFRIDFVDLVQGIVVLVINDEAKADALLKPLADGLDVMFKYKKRGLAGVPTWMDWDGCIGSVKILLTK